MGKVRFSLKSALESDSDFFQCPPHPEFFTQWAIAEKQKVEV